MVFASDQVLTDRNKTHFPSKTSDLKLNDQRASADRKVDCLLSP